MSAGKVNYWNEVKPILDKRCVVCHACYDAPCQTKLTAPEAISRGANRSSPYDVERVIDAEPTRLFEDSLSDIEWRKRGFHAIINEYKNSPKINRVASPMHELLILKEQHPTPVKNQQLDENEFSLELYRESDCPTSESMSGYTIRRPTWGMPYALPQLNHSEQSILKKWVVEGSIYTARKPLDTAVIDEIKKWESYLNNDSLKSRLVNRYIYEHLFLAHLYFEDISSDQFFRIIRSTTPPGQSAKPIVTRRPFDDPGVKRVYYRIVREKETVVAKSHLPYALGSNRMKFWNQLFYTNNFEVSELPGYAPRTSSNPFVSFVQIPANARYRFMLDEAQFTIMNFIKGSVCRGPVALNVIRDQFWVFFVNPDSLDATKMANFLHNNRSNLELPSVNGKMLNLPLRWIGYSRKERKYLESRNEFLVNNYGASKPVTLDLVWDGDKNNGNAALTIFRHFDSATIEKGLIGDIPETAWLIDYPLLERIHYLLVAGYDVYGNVAHQLLTRLHMDFLRIEGEANFLVLLPTDIRKKLRDRWYRDSTTDMADYVSHGSFENNIEPGIRYETQNPKAELFHRLKNKLSPVLRTRHEISKLPFRLQKMLNKLQSHSGRNVQALPEISFIRINLDGGSHVYVSLFRNNSHTNVSSISGEKNRIIPEESTVSVSTGIVGAYPSALMQVAESELDSFVGQLIALENQDELSQLMSRFGIRRTHPDFWALSDDLHTALYQQDAVEYGILDYIRLQNH